MTNDLLEQIFWIENQIQLAHWQENSGFRHQILGNYYSQVIDSFDSFVETLIGIQTVNENLECSESMYKVHNNIDLQTIFENILEILFKLRKEFEKFSGLINILDDLTAKTQQTKGLLYKS